MVNIVEDFMNHVIHRLHAIKDKICSMYEGTCDSQAGSLSTSKK